MAKAKLKAVEPQPIIKIDIGCGPNKKEGFVGLDRIKFGNVDHVLELGKDRWPFEDGSVEEAHSSHFFEHLTATERVHAFNELHRVLRQGGKAQIIVPHWASNRAYGDPTHQWPPVSEMAFYYIAKEWRMANAPHTDKSNWDQGFTCDFEATWGYSMSPGIMARNDEMRRFALENYKEAASDIIASLTKR